MPGRLLIDQYLDELRREMWSGSPFKERLLGEIEAHLREAAEREQEQGAAPEEAERRAIERFGPPQVMAPLLIAELAHQREPARHGGLMEPARRAILHACDEALQRGDPEYGTGHLLLGLLREEESCAVLALGRLGLSTAMVRTALEARWPPRHGLPGQVTKVGPSALRALQMADEEAVAFDLYYTSTEHLLLGVIREGEGLAAQVLMELGADLERTRAKVGEVFAQWNEIAAAQRTKQEARTDGVG